MLSTICAAISIVTSFGNTPVPDKPVMEFRTVTYFDKTYARILDTTTVRVFSTYITIKRGKKRFIDTVFVQNKEIRVRKYNSFKTDKEKFIASEEIRNYDLDMKVDFKAGIMKGGKKTHGTKRFYTYNDKKQVIEVVTKNPIDNNVSGVPEKFTWYADSVVRIVNNYKKTVIFKNKKDFMAAASKSARQDLSLYYTTKTDTGYTLEAFVNGIPEARSRSWKVDEHGIVKEAYDTQTKNGESKRQLMFCAKTEYVLLPKTKLSPEMKKALSISYMTGVNEGSFEKGDGLLVFPVKFD
ncbi:MAG TPA: hypothetical protein VK177_11265 [Flavobacteriales bacterium]|nr:hypothetical protein [Flavobacteriales bacterium]